MQVHLEKSKMQSLGSRPHPNFNVDVRPKFFVANTCPPFWQELFPNIDIGGEGAIVGRSTSIRTCTRNFCPCGFSKVLLKYSAQQCLSISLFLSLSLPISVSLSLAVAFLQRRLQWSLACCRSDGGSESTKSGTSIWNLSCSWSNNGRSHMRM